MSANANFAIENAVISRHLEGLPMTEIMKVLLPCFLEITYAKIRYILKKFNLMNSHTYHPKSKFISRKFDDAHFAHKKLHS